MSDEELHVKMEVKQNTVKKEKRVGKRVKFEQGELNRLKSLVLKYPQIEKKEHDKQNEKLKKLAWAKVCEEYNTDPNNSKRSTEQLMNAWKRIKKEWKCEQAAIRRSKFKTGGGPPSPVDIEETEEDIMMKQIMSEQLPLDSIPDDDCHGIPDELQLDEGFQTSIPIFEPSPGLSTAFLTTGADSSNKSEVGTPSCKTPDQGKRTTKKVFSFAETFHNKKMEYLKAEHELKMEVLRHELNYWKIMQQNANLRGEAGHKANNDSSEVVTARLISDVLPMLDN